MIQNPKEISPMKLEETIEKQNDSGDRMSITIEIESRTSQQDDVSLIKDIEDVLEDILKEDWH